MKLRTAVVLTGFAAGMIVFFTGCLQRFNNYGVKDMPLVSASGTLLVALIAENDATTYSENGGYRKTTYSTSYWLKQYQLATGKLVKKKMLVKAAEINNQSVELYGTDGKILWLHSDQLRAYDINTLEEITNQEKIAVANGKSPFIFPVDDRLIHPDIAGGLIDFVSDNGEEYRLQLNGLKIVEKAVIAGNDIAANPGSSRFFHEDNYATRCILFQNRVWFFAKDSTAAKEVRPYSDDTGEGAYRMKLFEAEYSIHKLGTHDSYTYGDIKKVTDSSYLNPVFIKDFNTESVVRLQNPAGCLVIHQDVLGSKSKAIITRLDAMGNKIWQSATGVSTKISGCMLNSNYCIITTNKDYMFSPFIGKDALCVMDVTNGKLQLLSLDE